MIVHNIGKVISRIPVGLDQNHVIELLIRDLDGSIDFVLKFRGTFIRDILPDDIWFARFQIGFNFLF